MNNIISKISEIESAASSIMDNANLQKQALSKDMEQRTKAFDEQLEAETNEKIQAMRSEMELEMQKQLDLQKQDTDKTIALLDQLYKKNHMQYVDQLFQDMIKE
ncbi:ATPase [Lachnoclostridium edouardi]|uniref:ATPase n=1 Tax=Lachnoclostridium edouardi TaxID=1926283 RepID=UPI000C7C1439|nr:ATPase [Lachnoclostridium edouardi]MDO4278460.1 ATPase [Lachnoclostridium edouardi]